MFINIFCFITYTTQSIFIEIFTTSLCKYFGDTRNKISHIGTINPNGTTHISFVFKDVYAILINCSFNFQNIPSNTHIHQKHWKEVENLRHELRTGETNTKFVFSKYDCLFVLNAVHPRKSKFNPRKQYIPNTRNNIKNPRPKSSASAAARQLRANYISDVKNLASKIHDKFLKCPCRICQIRQCINTEEEITNLVALRILYIFTLQNQTPHFFLMQP